MKVIKEIQTPLNTKMVEINLENAKDEKITKQDIQDALNMLYNANVEILEYSLNTFAKQLQGDILNDYIFKLKVNNKNEVALNFACCFLTYNDCKKLTDSNALSNVSGCLKALRNERYDRHPLYYKDYAKQLVDKFKATKI